MRFRRAGMFAILLSLLVGQAQAKVTRSDFLNIVQQGWIFEFRSSFRRHDPSLPPIRLNSKDIVNGQTCLMGDATHPLTERTIAKFESLLAHIFGRTERIKRVGQDIEDCGTGQRTYIRLYTGRPPLEIFNSDLRKLDQVHDIGLPTSRQQVALSPAQGNVFFGRHGTVGYLLVKQPPPKILTPLEKSFYASILIEELFQVFSFGMDILKFDASAVLQSKLQERPINLRHFGWETEPFMRGLVNSNPKALCAFDVFILHALARSTLETANTTEFLDYVSDQFDDLRALTQSTLSRGQYGPIFDPSCLQVPD